MAVDYGSIASWGAQTFALLLIVGAGIFGYYKYKSKQNWDVLITVFSQRGYSQIVTQDVGRQFFRDDDTLIQFKSKHLQIDLAGLDLRHFLPYEGKNFKRHLQLFTPASGVYVPMDNEIIQIKQRPVLNAPPKYCDLCRLEANVIAKKANPETPDYKIEGDHTQVCPKHLKGFFQAKFRVITEVSKDWYFRRVKERLERGNQPKWWENPVVANAIMGAIFIGGLFVIMYFGKQYILDAIIEGGKIAAETVRIAASGIKG